MVVRERGLVLSLFLQLCSCSSAFQQPFTFRFVSFKYIHYLVSMQTTFTEISGLLSVRRFDHVQGVVTLFTELHVLMY